jgi:hypothetical protein
MFRLLYQGARWQGHSVLRSLGYAIFDLKLPDLEARASSFVDPQQVPMIPADSVSRSEPADT